MTDLKMWQQIFDQTIATHEEVVITLRDTNGPIDGRVTKLAEGVYQIKGRITFGPTGESVEIWHLFPFESVVWIGASPMMHQRQPQEASGLSADEIEKLMREHDEEGTR